MKFSIKFKILLGISFLLLLCTAFNLGYSYKLFTEDKTSYIFENGLKKAENISEQINNRLNELSTSAEFNSSLLENAAVDYDQLINGQADMILEGIVSVKDGQVLITKQVVNNKNVTKISNSLGVTTEQMIKEVLDNTKDVVQKGKGKSWIYSPKTNVKFILNLSKMKSADNWYFAVTDFNKLLEMFSKDRVFTNKIISYKSPIDRKENGEWLNNIDYKTSKKGAFETKIQNEEVLLSYVFVNDKILVLNSINKSSAFGITEHLIVKTILFAALLLGVATIAGIYFSSSITYPIVKLTEGAKKMAEGDFNSEVEIKSSDEIKILGDTFNFMGSEIRDLLKNKEELIAKLEDYSKNLEIMVEQRTLELKKANDFMALMVNSLDQGLLVFDSQLNCNPMFTNACEPIFGISPLDKSMPEVLGITDEGNIQSLKQWAMVLFSEMIPFESAISLGPREKITGKSYLDSDYKNVKIDYYPMRDEEEKISNIVMIATDKTNEVQATEKAKEKEAYVSMILKILNNKTQFESFVNEVEEIFHQFNKAYSVENGTIEFDLVMMLFHTLNGGFGIYSLISLQQMARGFETEINLNKESAINQAEYIPVLQGNVEKLKQAFVSFRVDFDALVGTKFATNQSFFEVPRQKILELKDLVVQTHNEQLKEYFSDNFLKVPIINYFKAYDDLCKTTAMKINKEFNGLRFHNSDLKIEVEPLLEFFNVLVHLFRNCLDHGLEDSYTRQSNGKSADGHIDVSFDIINSPGGNFLSTIIQDDGAGIDPKIIRSRCQKLNPEEDISNLSDKEVIYKIFAPFFSTRDEVSALSGRGVGMSAIKEVVDRLNGQIEIESHVGKGTIFSFLIPEQTLL